MEKVPKRRAQSGFSTRTSVHENHFSILCQLIIAYVMNSICSGTASDDRRVSQILRPLHSAVIINSSPQLWFTDWGFCDLQIRVTLFWNLQNHASLDTFIVSWTDDAIISHDFLIRACSALDLISRCWWIMGTMSTKEYDPTFWLMTSSITLLWRTESLQIWTPLKLCSFIKDDRKAGKYDISLAFGMPRKERQNSVSTLGPSHTSVCNNKV